MQMMNRMQRTQQGSMRYNPGKKPKPNKLIEETVIPQCKLKRIRFEATAKRKSQIGGGKLFRQSQINDQLNLLVINFDKHNATIKQQDKLLKPYLQDEIKEEQQEEYLDYQHDQANTQNNNQQMPVEAQPATSPQKDPEFGTQFQKTSAIADDAKESQTVSSPIAAAGRLTGVEETGERLEKSKQSVLVESEEGKIESNQGREQKTDLSSQNASNIKPVNPFFANMMKQYSQSPESNQQKPKFDLKLLFQGAFKQNSTDKKNSKINSHASNCSSSSLKTEVFNQDEPISIKQSSIFNDHLIKYQEHCQRAKIAFKFNENVDEFVELVNYFKSNYVRCFKYNHCLDFDLQNHLSYQSFLYLKGPPNDLELIINNKIPVQDSVKHIINLEPLDTLKQRKEAHSKRSIKALQQIMANNFKKQLTQQQNYIQHSILGSHQISQVHNASLIQKSFTDHHHHHHHQHNHHHDTDPLTPQQCNAIKGHKQLYLRKSLAQQQEEEELAHQILFTELEEEIDDITFKDKQSSGSCKIADIQNILFGGVSSRFWLLRKHINMLSDQELQSLPFYSWQCITLQLKHRDVDLVIRDQAQMEKFLELLIRAMRTMDGQKNSANQLLDILNNQEINRYRTKVSDGTISEVDKQKIVRLNEHKFYQKIMMKYKIMTIRSKMSYIACTNLMTIKELLTRQIQHTYNLLCKEGLIKVNKLEQKIDEDIYQVIISSEAGVLKKILSKNIDKYQLQTEARKRIEEQLLQKPKKTKVEIKVLGVTVSKKINIEENKEKEERIQKLIRKDNCQNIFKDIQGNQAVDSMPHQQYVNYKFEKKTKEIILNKIRLLMNMKIISGDIYNRSIISKIELQKQLLILDIQLGISVYLNDEFNMNQFPLSYRYYDPILRIILKKLNPQRQSYYRNQKNLAKMYYEKATSQRILRLLGIYQSQNDEQDNRLSIRYKPINKAQRKEINYKFSKHAMQIQRSCYIKVDDDIEYQKEMYHSDFKNRDPDLYTVISNTGYKKEMANQKHDDQIDIKFMDPRLVNNQRKNFLMFKQSFLLRQNFLKSYGEKGKVMGKIESWIDDNIDQLYKNWAINHRRHHLMRRISTSFQFVFQQSDNYSTFDKSQPGPNNHSHSPNSTGRPSSQIKKKKFNPQNHSIENIRLGLNQYAEKGPQHTKRYYRDVLMKHAEKTLSDRRISKRQKTIKQVLDACPATRSIEEKEEFVDKWIEKEVKWFLTTRQQKTLDRFKEIIMESKSKRIKNKQKINDQGVGAFDFVMKSNKTKKATNSADNCRIARATHC